MAIVYVNKFIQRLQIHFRLFYDSDLSMKFCLQTTIFDMIKSPITYSEHCHSWKLIIPMTRNQTSKIIACLWWGSWNRIFLMGCRSISRQYSNTSHFCNSCSFRFFRKYIPVLKESAVAEKIGGLSSDISWNHDRSERDDFAVRGLNRPKCTWHQIEKKKYI